MENEELKSCIITGLLVFILTVTFLCVAIGMDEDDKEKTKNWTLEDDIKGIACYNLDGTGPISKCKSRIKCYIKDGTNTPKYETECPMFIQDSNK